MHVILTDFRDLARSVIDTGTETIMSAGGQGTLDLEADHEGSAVLAPLSDFLCTLLNKASLCTSSLESCH